MSSSMRCSLSLHWQIIGRVLRPAPGKTDALILDHSSNHLRLGFVTDDVPFELDEGKRGEAPKDRREKQAPLPTPCPSCAYLRPAGVHRCPSCGFRPERQSEVVNIDGELVPFAARTGGGKGAAKHVKERWYRELCQLAVDHGYSDGWVAHTYRDFFTVWPRGLTDSPAPVEVSAEVREFVRQKAEEYKRKMQGEESGGRRT